MGCGAAGEPQALARAERFAEDEAGGVGRVVTAVDRLAGAPRPEGASGSAQVPRIHGGVHRVPYEVGDRQARISALHPGRVR
ncbi:type II toxin-antitoxin system RelE/ParE family toxin [Streptomyces sp. NPDC001380]|uniref:type II toxin-antitoxin system RelE/ParE family toxin n=1 Tax=Streptomyces sp. NPDC001380 TaxID=3364566 RepID=UPI0036AB8A39